jgi:hypothetical protein
MQDSNDTSTQSYRHIPHPHATPSISTANIQRHSSVSSTPPACSKPNLSPTHVSQQQSNSAEWQGKRKHRHKDWVSDTESEPGTVSTYVTPTSSPERTGTNLRLCRPIPSGVLRMPDESQEYPRSHCSETPSPDSTPKGSNIKPSTFICGDPLNQQVFRIKQWLQGA